MLDRAAEFFFFGFAPLMAGILITPDFVSRGKSGGRRMRQDERPARRPSAVILPFPATNAEKRIAGSEVVRRGGETPLIP